MRKAPGHLFAAWFAGGRGRLRGLLEARKTFFQFADALAQFRQLGNHGLCF